MRWGQERERSWKNREDAREGAGGRRRRAERSQGSEGHREDRAGGQCREDSVRERKQRRREWEAEEENSLTS